jgi:hypothetical protein
MGYSNADRTPIQNVQNQQGPQAGITQFDDKRTSSTAQLQLQGMMSSSPLKVTQRKVQASIRSSIIAQKQSIPGASAREPNREHVNPLQSASDTIQMVVSPSATYVPGPNELNEIANLDGQIAAAEVTAQNRIANPPMGYVHTPTQAAYMANPTAAMWGYCVEEQLNQLAPGLGWATQYPLANSRPDYHKAVGGQQIFVDLTSAAQAGPAGGHITAKLDISAPNGIAPANWKAADITHNSLNPLNGMPAAPNYNGAVTQPHMQYFQRYHNFCQNPHANWDPYMENLFQYYGNISQARFTQVFNQNDRDLFVQRAQEEPDDSSSEDYSSDEYSSDVDMED